MNRNLQSQTKLTEFAPLSPEEESTSVVSSLFSRFFRYKTEEPRETTPAPSNDAANSNDQFDDDSWQNNDSTENNFKNRDPTFNLKEVRSLPNVRKRISNLLALRNAGRQSYNDTELKQYWMPDSVSKECYDCEEKFTTFRRRHHCRVCGQIFCSRCCNQEIPGKIMNCTGDLRVCGWCGRAVLSMFQSAIVGSESTDELQSIIEDLHAKFGEPKDPSYDTIANQGRGVTVTPDREESRRKQSVGYQEERFGNTSTRAESGRSNLRCLLDEALANGLLCSTHRYRLRTYHSCFLASQLVDWLVLHNKAANRIQAVALGQAILKSGHLECISFDSNVFSDSNQLFRIVPVDTLEEIFDSSADSDSEYMMDRSLRSSTSSFNVNEDNSKPMYNSTVDPCELTETNESVPENTIKAVEEVTSLKGDALPSIDWNAIDLSYLDEIQRKSLEILRTAFASHCSSYLRQMLNTKAVPQSWAEIICPIACKVVKTIHPERAKGWSEAMDIRQYVHVKKVGGGERRECEIIEGVVCSKNLTHRGMPKKMVDPKILLLSSALMYQRVEGKYLSLEPLIMQENDYAQRTISKILDLGPNLVIVGKSVTRLAQELLYSRGISLVINVKPSLLDRLAKLTGADVLNSIDAHLGKPKLGTCKLFQLRTYTNEFGKQKTLMMFEGCQYPELGCTILLRGASTHELSKVKKATSSLVFAYYNARLEVSYHMDSGVKPPMVGNVFLDSLEESTDEPSVGKAEKINHHQNTNSPLHFPQSSLEERHKTEAVSDFSDPLRGWEGDRGENTVGDQLAVEEIPFSNKLREAIEENILSISPFLKFSLPYLESETGRNCTLRSFFGKQLYWSAQLYNNYPKPKYNFPLDTVKDLINVKLKEVHEFINAKLRDSFEAPEVKRMLASYRASGGRVPISASFPMNFQNHALPHQTKDINKDGRPNDILDPDNHQRLLTLFCSYSPMRVSPTFCVDPAIVNMEMYGHMDIPLGMFLEKYCFKVEYMCGSCEIPIRHHTRRFVHNGAVVNIKLHTLDKELSTSSAILMWTSCGICNQASQIRCMSPGTRSLSFAKYLELRFHGDMYQTRDGNCQHSPYQDHIHHFAMGSILASFMYSKIYTWEISLPPKELKTDRDMYMESLKMDEIKTWSLMGNQVFSLALNKFCSFNIPESMSTMLKQQLQKDQAAFKARLEEAQQKVSIPLEDSSNLNVKLIWNVEDALVMIKRQLAENIEEWNVRLSDAEAISKKEDKRKSVEVKPSQNPLNSEIIDGEKESNDDIMETSDLQIGEEINETEDKPVNTEPCDTESAADTDDGDGGTHQVAAAEVKVVQHDKKTVKTILSQFLPTSNQNVHLQMPANQMEHYLLPMGVLMPLVVYEKEPSSIIAYALNCHDYKQALDQLRASHAAEQSTSSPSSKRKSGELSKDSFESSNSDRRSGVLSYLRSSSSGSMDKGSRGMIEGVQYNPNIEVPMEDEPKVEDKNKVPKSETQNIEVLFSDGSATFKVKIYYAEDFSRLRATILPEGEEGFIRSLSRCVAWAASGGKSGSNFNKTRDDRFILKAMTRLETQLFMNFAPQYFNYINCVSNGMPTLLGKIVGVFRVVTKSERTSTTLKVLVMEHLFHGRAVKHKFDLKGSMRNRLISTNNDQTETVLLDENLIKMTCDNPLYVLSHSKTVLMQAIQNDTEFLASQSVMDYSLLVGLDETKKELVVGIIDYIRGYTWDKKIETMVKRIGQNKEPTIIPADEYRERFIAAMHKYFLPVPDRWTGLGRGVDMIENEIKRAK